MKITKRQKRRSVRWITFTAVLLAMNIALSSFGVPVPGGHFYLNDIVIILAAIILDPFGAFIVGGVGSFLGDLFFYPLPMWVSLITRGVQSVVISVLAHYSLKRHPVLASSIGTAVGAVIMVVGYSLGRAFWYSTPQYAIAKLPYQILQAVLGGVIALVLAWKAGIIKLFQRMVPDLADAAAGAQANSATQTGNDLTDAPEEN